MVISPSAGLQAMAYISGKYTTWAFPFSYRGLSFSGENLNNGAFAEIPAACSSIFRNVWKLPRRDPSAAAGCRAQAGGWRGKTGAYLSWEDLCELLSLLSAGLLSEEYSPLKGSKSNRVHSQGRETDSLKGVLQLQSIWG